MVPSKILVVDDQPINVQMLKRKLEREGMAVTTAASGVEALDRVRDDPPDLILLDVMMPEMGGLEVCRRLQGAEETRTIPIIFITASTSKAGKLEGLSAGAVDYITKPIDLDETCARVRTQLRFVAINRELVDLQHRLAEARRSATIGAVTQGIAHNLNNLLGIVIGYLELIKAHPDRPDSVRRNAAQVESAVQRIVAIIKQLSSLVVKTRFPTLSRPLDQLLAGAVDRYRQEFGIEQPVTIDNPLGVQPVETHVEIFEDAVSKILINAWEAYGDAPPERRPIRIETRLLPRPTGSVVQIRVEDQGRGIDPEIRDHMYEPFVSSKQTVGVGMGLTVARHAMRNLGGDLVLFDRPQGGAVAELSHPVEQRRRRRDDDS